MVYYKLRQVLQSAMDLLQIATGITKCDDYYKLRQYRRWLQNHSIKSDYCRLMADINPRRVGWVGR